MVGNKLIEYLKDGDKNIYEYSNGSLTAVKEYDFDEYNLRYTTAMDFYGDYFE